MNGPPFLPYPTSASCLTVAQELNGTTVDMKCCVAKEGGNVTLGQNDEEEFHVGKGKSHFLFVK